MDFFLDSLFYSLVIICIILAARLIKTRLLIGHKSRNLHPVLLPLEWLNDQRLKVSYELPFDNEVEIALLNEAEEPVQEPFKAQQKAGNYFLNLESDQMAQVRFIRFQCIDTKVLRKVDRFSRS